MKDCETHKNIGFKMDLAKSKWTVFKAKNFYNMPSVSIQGKEFFQRAPLEILMHYLRQVAVFLSKYLPCRQQSMERA